MRSELTAFMDRRGLRSTEQRRVIIDQLFEVTDHVTIDQLLESVRAVDPRVGYATVYRTMKLLAEGGLVHERKFGDGFTRYELADEHAHHDHLICTQCGTLIEFYSEVIENKQDEIARKFKFQPTHHSLRIFGICDQCQAKRQAVAS